MVAFQRIRMQSFAIVDFLVVIYNVIYNVADYCCCYFVGMEPERSEVFFWAGYDVSLGASEGHMIGNQVHPRLHRQGSRQQEKKQANPGHL